MLSPFTNKRLSCECHLQISVIVEVSDGPSHTRQLSSYCPMMSPVCPDSLYRGVAPQIPVRLKRAEQGGGGGPGLPCSEPSNLSQWRAGVMSRERRHLSQVTVLKASNC